MYIPTPEEIAPYVQRKLIRSSRHESLGLTVYNYSQDCQTQGAWNPVTRVCRGLILDDSGQPAALPWSKFYNHEGYGSQAPPNRPPDEVTIKADGSMGIGFVFQGAVRWSSRGSLNSVQAQIAAKIWETNHGQTSLSALEDLTLIVEIIHPTTHQLVPYGDQEKLILLGARQTSTGFDLRRPELEDLAEQLEMEITPIFSDRDLASLQARTAAMDASEEGYVLRWYMETPEDFRLKVKSQGYLRASTLLAGFNERKVMEYWYFDLPYPSGIPEETVQWADTLKAGLEAEVDAFRIQVQALIDGYTRPRNFIRDHKRHPLSKLALATLNGKLANYKMHVFRQRYPKSHPRNPDDLKAQKLAARRQKKAS